MQVWSDGLLESGFGSPSAARALSWPSRVERMLEVERALAAAQAELGLIPAEEARVVAAACDLQHIDLAALADEASHAATPVIPLIRAITARGSDPATAHLHYGATSQDIIDTATVLQVRDVLDLLESELRGVAAACARLAEQHRHTIAAGRTLGQQAVPVTMGLRAARWLAAVCRRLEQLRMVRPRVLQVQLGGAAGTLAVYGARGPELMGALGRRLGLATPELPWHAERDRIVELAGLLAGVTNVVAKVATDLVLLSQTEIGEVQERGSPGPGSSAMPHKRNPVDATAARAAARLALGEVVVLLQAGESELERAAGAWQAEWVALPSALVRTVGAVERLHRALAGLQVDPDRARANLDEQLGLTASESLAAALTERLGRSAAQALSGELGATAIAERRHLRDVTASDERVTTVLSEADLQEALDAATALRAVDDLIDRALEFHRRTIEPRS